MNLLQTQGVPLNVLPTFPPKAIAPLSVSVPITVTTTTIAVFGINKTTGRIYAVSNANGHYNTSDDGGTTWVDKTFSASVFTPNMVGTEFDATFMYFYSSDGKIYRAAIDVFNAWTTITVPGLPAGTTGRPGSLIALGSGVLLYGNYNANPSDGAIIYRSTDSGATWTQVLNVTTARHVHAIRKSPNTGFIWASVGDAGFTGIGLYKSINNGVTWIYMSSNLYGIDMVFTAATASRPNMVVLEGDGSSKPQLLAFPEYGNPGDLTQPLIWFTGAPADAACTRGTARGIGLTPNGDIIYFTTTESGAVGVHSGLYIVSAPWLIDNTLLKDTTGAEAISYLTTVIFNAKVLNYLWTFPLPTYVS